MGVRQGVTQFGQRRENGHGKGPSHDCSRPQGSRQDVDSKEVDFNSRLPSKLVAKEVETALSVCRREVESDIRDTWRTIGSTSHRRERGMSRLNASASSSI